MKIFFLIILMFTAYIGTWWWRKHVTKKHREFKTRMDLASDDDHARQQIQAYYQKQGGKGNVKK